MWSKGLEADWIIHHYIPHLQAMKILKQKFRPNFQIISIWFIPIYNITCICILMWYNVFYKFLELKPNQILENRVLGYFVINYFGFYCILIFLRLLWEFLVTLGVLWFNLNLISRVLGISTFVVSKITILTWKSSV